MSEVTLAWVWAGLSGLIGYLVGVDDPIGWKQASTSDKVVLVPMLGIMFGAAALVVIAVAGWFLR